MLSGLVMIAPLMIGALALGAVLLLVPRRRRQVAIDEVRHPGLRDLRAKTTIARYVGLAVALFAAWVMANWPQPWVFGGRGVMVAPLAFSGVLVLALLAGDLAATGDARSRRGRRAAALAHDRRLSDLLPRTLTSAVASITALLLGLLAFGWILGIADDTGRPGRSLRWTSPDGMFSSGAGPWPGSYYGSLALPGVLVVLVILALALTVTARRPRDGSDPEIVRVDSILRRRESESLIAAAGLGICLLTAGLALFATTALFGTASNATMNGFDAGSWLVPAAWATLATCLTAVGVALWCGVVLVVPGAGPSRRRVTASVAEDTHA